MNRHRCAVPLQPPERLALVHAIHAAPGMIVLAVAGGGVAAITDLLLIPGASRTILEVSVPYCARALDDLIRSGPGGPSGAAVSESTAAAMAAACLLRAAALRPDAQTPVAGVACTAALVTDRERRGADRACLAVARDQEVDTWTVSLTKESAGAADRSRAEQDRAVADQLLRAIAETLGGITP